MLGNLPKILICVNQLSRYPGLPLYILAYIILNLQSLIYALYSINRTTMQVAADLKRDSGIGIIAIVPEEIDMKLINEVISVPNSVSMVIYTESVYAMSPSTASDATETVCDLVSSHAPKLFSHDNTKTYLEVDVIFGLMF